MRTQFVGKAEGARSEISIHTSHVSPLRYPPEIRLSWKLSATRRVSRINSRDKYSLRTIRRITMRDASAIDRNIPGCEKQIK